MPPGSSSGRVVVGIVEPSASDDESDLSEEVTEWEFLSSDERVGNGQRRGCCVHMHKVFNWIRDRKTGTVRKWRSNGNGMGGENGASDGALNRAGGENKKYRKKKSNSVVALSSHAPSTMSLPPTMEETARKVSDYEEFFKEAEPAIVVHRRPSSSRIATFEPVLPPDVQEAEPRRATWLAPTKERRNNSSSPLPPRSPKIIRFNIPEVQVSFEEEEPQVLVSSRQRSSSPQPGVEIEWSPNTRPGSSGQSTSMDGSSMSVRPSLQTVSFDAEDVITASAASRVGSERPRRQSQAAAMRRQSTIQTVQSMSGRRSSTTLIPLTFPQIHLIRTLWRQIYISKGPTVIGTSLFHRLCFKSPELKDQIRAAPLPPQFNNHDEFVKAHCKAVADLIDQVVEALDNLDSMTEELMRVGRVHAKLSRGGVTGKLWNLTAETFIDCTLEWGDRRCRSETVRKAWALIIAFMIEKIKLGHNEQRKIMLSSRSSMSQIEALPFHSLSLT